MTLNYKNFSNYKIVNINNQVVKKKSPWIKVFSALLVTAFVILVFYLIKPNFTGSKIFFNDLKGFFNFESYKDNLGYTQTVGDTFSKTLFLLGKTIIYSFLGTVIGVFFSVPIALLSSKNIMKKWYIYTPFRVFMSLFRSIPPLIIAFLMFNIFSQNLSATLALAVFVTSLMTKWLYEELDSLDLKSFESLQSLGNQKSRSIVKAVFPRLVKAIVSYGVYAFEMVIRFASILGVVGIATIGVLIKDDFQSPDKWGHMSIVLYTLIITIILIEVLSILFKKFVLNHLNKRVDIEDSKSKKYNIAKVRISKPKFWIVKVFLMSIFLLVTIYSITQINWSIANSYKLNQFKSAMKDLFKPDWSLFKSQGVGLSNVLIEGSQALLVAFASAVIGLLFSFFIGILASKNFTGKYFSWFFRIIIITIRSIPAFTYVFIVLSLSPENQFLFAGVLALGIHSIGMLGKLTYEKIDSISLESRKALEVMGSTRIMSTRWALIQEAIPTILSNAIYRIEINFKSTVQIGAVGASVFGQKIAIYSADTSQFSKLSSYLIFTMATVLILEQISNALRRKIMTGYFLSKNNIIFNYVRKRKKINAMAYAKAFKLDYFSSLEQIKFLNYLGPKLTFNKSRRDLYLKEKNKIKSKKV